MLAYCEMKYPQKYEPSLYQAHVNTRSANGGELNVPRARTKAGEKAFYIRGPQTWNTLPNKLRGITKLNEFKHEMVNYLLSMRETFE